MQQKMVVYFISTLFLIGCTPIKSYEIDSLWNLREHDSEMNTFHHCNECNTESHECCIYEYHNKKYDRGESYILDDNGKIDSIYSYRVPLGANIISVEDQIRLSVLDSVYREELRDRKIYWNTELNAIVDGDSIYKNFEIDSDKKYLIVKNESELKLYKYN